MSEEITKYNYSVPHPIEIEMTRKVHPRLVQITPVVFEWGELITWVNKNHAWLCYADTFKEYCEKHLHMTKQRAYQWMDAWAVRQSLPEEGQQIVDSESKARALSPVEPKRRMRVIREAQELAPNGVPTARHITEAAERVAAPKPLPPQKPPPDKVMLDATGWPVPQPLEVLFDRIPEVQEYLRQLSGVRAMLKRVQESRDVLWQPVDYSSAGLDIDRAYAQLKLAIPYAVCPACQGRDETRSHCTTCKKRGVISKFLWDTGIPEELKAVRAKSVKK